MKSCRCSSISTYLRIESSSPYPPTTWEQMLELSSALIDRALQDHFRGEWWRVVLNIFYNSHIIISLLPGTSSSEDNNWIQVKTECSYFWRLLSPSGFKFRGQTGGSRIKWIKFNISKNRSVIHFSDTFYALRNIHSPETNMGRDVSEGIIRTASALGTTHHKYNNNNTGSVSVLHIESRQQQCQILVMRIMRTTRWRRRG